MLGKTVRDFLPVDELLPYVTAIMRVYNRFGRRDNKYKARVKILVHELGLEAFKAEVEAEYAKGDHGNEIEVSRDELARIQAYFAPPAYEDLPERDPEHDRRVFQDKDFAQWVRANVAKHKVQGYAIVNVSLKPVGGIPGDASAEQMRAVAELAERYGKEEIRVTHEQNLVLPYVAQKDLYPLWQSLERHDLGTPNLGLITDIIACPGLDYCALATARSIPVAQAISRRFEGTARQDEIGELKIKISGCINACGHHHVGHIGILGLDKQGKEFYQITVGGSGAEDAAIGRILGPGFAAEEVPDAIERLVQGYLKSRNDASEPFLDWTRRVGQQELKEALYAAA